MFIKRFAIGSAALALAAWFVCGFYPFMPLPAEVKDSESLMTMLRLVAFVGLLLGGLFVAGFCAGFYAWGTASDEEAVRLVHYLTPFALAWAPFVTFIVWASFEIDSSGVGFMEVLWGVYAVGTFFIVGWHTLKEFGRALNTSSRNENG